jgi:hypothetical protein
MLCVQTKKKSVDFNHPVHAFYSINLSEYIIADVPIIDNRIIILSSYSLSGLIQTHNNTFNSPVLLSALF